MGEGVNRLTVADKRTFLHMAHHPYGDLVCRQLGLVPPSEDVRLVEEAAAVVRLHAFLASPEYDKLCQLASWYHDSVEAAVSVVPEELTDIDHMLSFFAAARTFLTPEKP